MNHIKRMLYDFSMLAEGQVENQSPLTNVLLNLLPWILIAIVIYFFFFRNLKANKESVAKQIADNEAYKASVVVRLDRIISLLEGRSER